VPSTSSTVPDRDDDEAAQQTLAYRTTQIRKRRAAAYSGQVEQAEKVVKRTRVELKAGVASDNVAVPIPLVDHGHGDPRNILGVIVNRDLDTYQYTIAVKAEVLHGRYSRNQFDLCPQQLLTLDDVNEENQVSLRTAVHAQSACGGQGFLECNCSRARKCKTNRCKCFKAKVKCNSRCHASLNCANK